MNNKIMIPVIIGVAGAGVGFIGGMQYQKINGVRNFAQNARGMMQNVSETRMGRGEGRGMATGSNNGKMMQQGNGAIAGEVSAKDDKTLTIKMNDGSSKIVILSDSTTYHMSSDASLDKIEVGTKVATFGSSNSDGSTTAMSIEINPVMRGQGTSTATN